jgi:hypothetical protein
VDGLGVTQLLGRRIGGLRSLTTVSKAFDNQRPCPTTIQSTVRGGVDFLSAALEMTMADGACRAPNAALFWARHSIFRVLCRPMQGVTVSLDPLHAHHPTPEHSHWMCLELVSDAFPHPCGTLMVPHGDRLGWGLFLAELRCIAR